MKQKYKVFINDQEIVFLEKSAEIGTSISLLPENISPMEIYRQLSGISLPVTGTYAIITSAPVETFMRFISNFKVIEAAGGLVSKSNEPDEFLMIFRKGKWDLPKGKIDKNEATEHAAIREIEEECGITGLKINDKLESTYHLYENKNQIIIKKSYWFKMNTSDISTPMPQVEEGITEARWVNKNELEEILPLSYASIRSLIINNVLDY